MTEERKGLEYYGITYLMFEMVPIDELKEAAINSLKTTTEPF